MHSLEDIASDSALHVGIPTISVRIRTAPTWLVLRTQVVELMQQTTKSAHYYSNAMGRHDELTRSKSHCANNLCEMRYVQLPLHSSQSFQKKYPKAHGVRICNLF